MGNETSTTSKKSQASEALENSIKLCKLTRELLKNGTYQGAAAQTINACDKWLESIQGSLEQKEASNG